jgi:PAS domain S-box-containing protein
LISSGASISLDHHGRSAVTQSIDQPPDLAAATRALFEGLPEAAVILQLNERGDDVQVVAVNATLQAEMERTGEELVGQLGSELYPAEVFVDVLDKARCTVEQQRPTSYEAVRTLPMGRRTMAVTMLPVGRRLLVAFGRDVSDEREASRNLERVERSARVGSWHWNITDGGLQWSEQYRRILGIGPDVEPSRSYLMSVVHPDDQARVQAGMDRVAAGGAPSPGVRFRIRRPDGQIRTVEGRGEVDHDVKGDVVSMSGILQDVTEQAERERRERQIEEIEARQRQALELNDDIVQGLASAYLACQLGRVEQAEQIVARTMDAAQALVTSLLRRDATGDFVPGGLVRGPTPDDHVERT